MYSSKCKYVLHHPALVLDLNISNLPNTIFLLPKIFGSNIHQASYIWYVSNLKANCRQTNLKPLCRADCQNKE